MRWVEERKFWIFESVMFFISGISYSLVFLRQKQHVRISFAPLWLELDTLPFSGSQNVPEDSEADSSRSLTSLQCLRSVILSVILSQMIFQASGKYLPEKASDATPMLLYCISTTKRSIAVSTRYWWNTEGTIERSSTLADNSHNG